jgi:imidazolonepropionase
MEGVDLLAVVNCGQIVTVSGPKRPRIRNEMGDLAIIERGGMLVRNGVIEAVGTQHDINVLLFDEIPVVDAAGGVVLPGFVDAHTHAVFAGTRVDEYERRARGETYAEIAAAGGGIRSTVQKTRAATEDTLLESARRYGNWFSRCGTTTIEAKSGYGLNTEAELRREPGPAYSPCFCLHRFIVWVSAASRLHVK